MDKIIIEAGDVAVEFPAITEIVHIDGDDGVIEVRTGEGFDIEILTYGVGPRGEPGAQGTVTPELEAARDQALEAAYTAQGAASQAEAAKATSKTYRDAAGVDAGRAERAAVESTSANSDAQQAKTDAVAAMVTAEQHRAATQDFRDEAEIFAQDAIGGAESALASEVNAVDASQKASDSELAAEGYKSAAATSATNAATSLAETLVARDETIAANGAAALSAAAAKAAEDGAKLAEQGAVVASSNATGVKTDVFAARDASREARDQSVAAKSASETAQSLSEAARDAAQTSEDNAEAAATEANEHRQASAASAASAKESADRAALFDPSSYSLKSNNGSDFDDPAAVRANIGAAAVLQDVTQAEAEAGEGGDNRNWSSQRVRQAVSAYAAPKVHGHAAADIDGLEDALAAKADLSSPVFVGSPTAPTPTSTDVSTRIATTEFVKAKVDELIGGATSAYDTFKELQDMMQQDDTETAAIVQQLGNKSDKGHGHLPADIDGLVDFMSAAAPKDSPVFVGLPTAPTQVASDNSAAIATTAHVKAAIANSGLSTEGHKHSISDITDLQQTLDGKASIEHRHVPADIDGLAEALATLATKADPTFTGTVTVPTPAVGDSTTKAASTAFVSRAVTNAVADRALVGHGHVIADTAGLQAALDGKMDGSIETSLMRVRRVLNGGEDLDLFVATGIWTQSANAQAASGNGYPVSLAGTLEVFAGGAGPMQRYTTYNSGAGNPKVYLRASYSGVWSAWKLISDDGHGHSIANVLGLQAALDGKLGATEQAADSAKVAGFSVDANATGNTIVQRNSSGDITGRYYLGSYVSMSHAAAARTTDTVFFSSTDNYIRKNTLAGFKSSLLLAYGDISGTIPNADISGAYTGFTNVTGTGVCNFARYYGTDADTAAAPSFTNAADLNTGIWFPAADQVGITVGGTNRVTFAAAGMTCTGNITAYSDERLKTDIERIQGALGIVHKLRGVRFKMNKRRGLGVIAQELQKVAPELVHQNDDGMLSVAYGNITGILIEAIKELSDQVEELRRAA